MRIWGVFCLLGCISNLYAASNRGADGDEKPLSGIVSSHVEEAVYKDDADEQKTDLSSFLKETNEVLKSPQEDSEKPETFLIVSTDQSSATGGGVYLRDPNIIIPPLKENSWWEKWWDAIVSWFSDEGSDRQ